MSLIHIFALPRSGTAFVATMLNLNPRCIAHHELYEKTDFPKQVIERSLRAYPFVVDCNTHGWLMKDYKRADINICIRRNTEESCNAVELKLGTSVEKATYDRCAVLLDKWAMNSNVFLVYYEYLFTLNILGQIWDYCFNGSEMFPVNKVVELLTLNIQMNDVSRITSEKFINKFKNDIR